MCYMLSLFLIASMQSFASISRYVVTGTTEIYVYISIQASVEYVLISLFANCISNCVDCSYPLPIYHSLFNVLFIRGLRKLFI